MAAFALHTFNALHSRNFRLWFYGQVVSLLGTWMQFTAQSFLVFELTRSPAYLGYISMAMGLPSWLLLLYGGVIADRLPRRTLLLVTQSCMMLVALALALITFSGLVRPWHILMMAALLGTANAFDAPARQAFVVDLVERRDLSNAIALNSMLFNGAAVIGPAVAGFLYMLAGPGWCFLANGISYLAIIAGLLLMRISTHASPPTAQAAGAAIMEGLRYALARPPIVALMLTVSATCLFGFSFATLMPDWSVTILGGDASTNGLLQSARGGGAVAGALLIASLGRFTAKGRLLFIGLTLFPLLLFTFAHIRQIPLALIALAALGIALTLVMNLSTILLQDILDDHIRGRIMSLYSLTHFGLMPLGGLLAGLAASRLGSPLTIMGCSLICLLFAAITFYAAPGVRRMR
jgi:MFS family permease